MAFRYSRDLGAAVSDELRIVIGGDPRFLDARSYDLQVKDLDSGRVWFLPVPYEEREITYFAAGRSHTHMRDVSATIPRGALERLSREIIGLKKPSHDASVEAMSEDLRRGVFEYLTSGGYLLKFIPDYAVEIID